MTLAESDPPPDRQVGMTDLWGLQTEVRSSVTRVLSSCAMGTDSLWFIARLAHGGSPPCGR